MRVSSGPLRALSEASAGALRNRIEAFEKAQACEAQQALAFKAHLPFSWLSDVITNPIILDAVEDILGPNLLCWGSSFFQKNANDPRFVSWHQDTYYYGLEPPETLTVWLSITMHSNSESGCVRVVPGSHRNRKVWRLIILSIKITCLHGVKLLSTWMKMRPYQWS